MGSERGRGAREGGEEEGEERGEGRGGRKEKNVRNKAYKQR